MYVNILLKIFTEEEVLQIVHHQLIGTHDVRCLGKPQLLAFGRPALELVNSHAGYISNQKRWHDNNIKTESGRSASNPHTMEGSCPTCTEQYVMHTHETNLILLPTSLARLFANQSSKKCLAT